MGITEDLKGEIVRRVLDVVVVEKIILFGSASTGSMTRDSDVDLLILEASGTDPNRDWLCIQRALRGMGYPFDIVVMTKDRFEETKNIFGGIAYPANKHGRVIYEAA